ncbi:MAG: hypothetical protein LIO92_04735 [Clostridiales bacterium]|nr:hypothetical protein [Clostridiales bacterium]
MSKWRKTIRRTTAFFLAVLMTVNLAGCSDKQVPGVNCSKEENLFSMEELGELPEPTTFPAPGYLGVTVPVDKIIDSDGLTNVTFRDNYLPVIVDENHVVYGKLDSLQELLDFSVFPNEENPDVNVKVTLGKTSIFLTAGSNIASYGNALFNVNVDMGNQTIYYEDNWYVPLDAFLRMTGLKGGYKEDYEEEEYAEEYEIAEESSAVTNPLLLFEREETVLDRLEEFYPLMYSTYAFEYGKDLGYSMEDQSRLNLSALEAVVMQGIGSLDSYSWKYLLLQYRNDASIVNAKYIRMFADAMLEMDEAQASKLLEHKTTAKDFFSSVLSAANYEETTEMEKILNTLKEEKKDVKLIDANYAGSAESFLKAFEVADKVKSTAKYLSSYHSLATSFANGDIWMKEACEQFLEQKDKLDTRYLDDSLYKVFSDRVDAYGNSGFSLDIMWQWWAENLVSVAAEGVSMMKIAFFGKVTLASELWEMGTNMLFGEELNQAESFLTGMQGTLYETDAMAVLSEIYQKDFRQGGKKTWTANDELELRYALCNVVKACYVTRYFGQIGVSSNLSKYQELLEKTENEESLQSESVEYSDEVEDYLSLIKHQNSLQNQLVSFLVDFSDTDKSFGMMQADLANLDIDESVHYPNVIFTLTELTGQVLSWEDESPVSGVKLQLKEEDGTLLAECVTGEEGRFDLSFDMAGADSLDTDTAAVRTLTAEMNYKKYPVVMQDMEVTSGKKYEVNGLHVGERSEDRLIYLDGARTTNDGQVMILGREIDLGEDSFAVDVPDYQGGIAYTAYFSSTGEFEVLEQNSYQLRDGVTFGSFYTASMPEGGWADTLMKVTGVAGSSLPDALLNREMHTEEEINDFVAAYRKLNREQSPVLVITTVNSEVKAAEPSNINQQ